MITVFYEDAPGVQVTNFGPHMLALACVADRLGLERYELQRFATPVPMKGDSKLRAAIRGANRRDLAAVFDSDKVRRLFELDASTTDVQVTTAILEESGIRFVVLLVRNIEDIINQCCSALRIPPPTRKPTPEERDRYLHRTAAADAGVRTQVLASSPSFAQLVDELTGAIQEAQADEIAAVLES